MFSLKRIVPLFVLALISACGGVQPDAGTTTATGGGTSTGTGTGTDTEFLFKVDVATQYESNDKGLDNKGTCKVGPDVTPRSDSGGTVVNCPAISIPEQQLFFSNVHFTVTAAPDKCKIIFFRPYFYRISTSATYTPPTATGPLDCSKNDQTEPATCYGGAGTLLIPSFPRNGGQYFLPGDGTTLTNTWIAKSANSQRQTGGAYSYLDNRWTINDLADRVAFKSYNGQDIYVANSMVDWRIVCTDTTDHLYEMNLFLTADKGPPAAGGTPFVSFPTWHINDLPMLRY